MYFYLCRHLIHLFQIMKKIIQFILFVHHQQEWCRNFQCPNRDRTHETGIYRIGTFCPRHREVTGRQRQHQYARGANVRNPSRCHPTFQTHPGQKRRIRLADRCLCIIIAMSTSALEHRQLLSNNKSPSFARCAVLFHKTAFTNILTMEETDKTAHSSCIINDYLCCR